MRFSSHKVERGCVSNLKGGLLGVSPLRMVWKPVSPDILGHCDSSILTYSGIPISLGSVLDGERLWTRNQLGAVISGRDGSFDKEHFFHYITHLQRPGRSFRTARLAVSQQFRSDRRSECTSFDVSGRFNYARPNSHFETGFEGTSAYANPSSRSVSLP